MTKYKKLSERDREVVEEFNHIVIEEIDNALENMGEMKEILNKITMGVVIRSNSTELKMWDKKTGIWVR